MTEHRCRHCHVTIEHTDSDYGWVHVLHTYGTPITYLHCRVPTTTAEPENP